MVSGQRLEFYFLSQLMREIACLLHPPDFVESIEEAVSGEVLDVEQEISSLIGITITLASFFLIGFFRTVDPDIHMVAGSCQRFDEAYKLIFSGFVTHQDLQPKASEIVIGIPFTQDRVFDHLACDLLPLRLGGLRYIRLLWCLWE